MKLIKIAQLGKDNKVCYDAAGNMYHVPENFRATIKVGEFCTIINKHFENSTVIATHDILNDKGEVVTAAGEKSLTGPAFDRLQVSSVGDKDTVLANAGESQLLAKELDLWVAKETATIAVKYDTKSLQPA